MLCGVGGQGTILAADLLAKVATAAGLDVKLSEVHGMSQRGGSVDTVVRFGEEVLSPVTDPGMVDHLVGFEFIEAMRRVHYVKPQGQASRQSSGDQAVARADRRAAGARMVSTPSWLTKARSSSTPTRLACEAGSPKSANVVLMGALSLGLPFAEESWREVIAGRVPAQDGRVQLAGL